MPELLKTTTSDACENIADDIVIDYSFPSKDRRFKHFVLKTVPELQSILSREEITHRMQLLSDQRPHASHPLLEMDSGCSFGQSL